MFFDIIGMGEVLLLEIGSQVLMKNALLLMFPEVYDFVNAIKTRRMHEDDSTIIIFPMTLTAEHYYYFRLIEADNSYLCRWIL